MVDKANEYLGQGYPVCIIDALPEHKNALNDAMLEKNMPFSKVLGYSSWNTVSNAVGVSLSNAVSRLIYLTHADEVTDESNDEFLKTIAFSFIKDISYKCNGITNLNDSSTYGPQTLLDVINISQILVKDLAALKDHGTVSVSDFTYPWGRGFEARFTVTVN